MTIRNYELSIKQGSNFRLAINVTDNGVVKNLTGYSPRMQIRKFASSDDVLAEVTPHITINNPILGQIAINIPASVTSTYDWGHGVYDLEVFTAADADVICVLEGIVSISEEVTRP